MKPTREAVSLVIKDSEGKFLIIKRGDVAEDQLAGAWGFPAIKKQDTETDLEAAQHVALIKLGIRVTIGDKIGESTEDRRDYTLRLVDYAAIIAEGTPSVPQPGSNYSELVFTNDYSLLFAAANRGSQCTKIFLESQHVDWQELPHI